MLKKLDFKKLIKDGKFLNVLIICGVLGVALIFLSSITNFTSDSEQNSTYSVAEYKEDIQSSLQNILEQIDGVGNVSVLLTIENSVEGVYLENSSTKTKEIEPVIRGVVIACDGGDDDIVTQRVLSAVTKALNISSAKVCITKLK
jgi:stage III sporulation protein AG